MKIDSSTEEFNKKSLDNLTHKQRHLVSQKEKELDELSKIYKQKEADLKFNNQVELIDLRNEHTQNKTDEMNRDTEFIGNYQKKLQDQKKFYENELNELNQLNKTETKNNHIIHRMKLDENFIKNRDDEIYLTEKMNTERKKLQNNTLSQIRDAQNDEFATIQSIKYNINKNIEENKLLASPTSSKGLSEQKDATRLKHEKQLDLNRQAKSQYIKESELKNSHSTQLEQENQNFKNNLKTKQDIFLQRYKEVADTQNTYLDRIQHKFDDDLKKITESHALQKKIFDEKQNDNFYKVTKLEPKIQENEKNYTVSIKIPEHEKDQVQITAQERKVRLGHTRRFSDSTVGEDGSKSSSSRSETVSREFTVPHILDSRKITQKYEDGKIIFKIEKL